MIDDFLDELDRLLRVSARVQARILDEVRDHLHDSAADHQSAGLDRRGAEEQAVRAFGHAEHLARQFNAQAATATMRRTPVVIGASAVSLVGGLVLAAVTQPQPKAAVPAGVLVQVSFFAASLGLQVAAVAGARAAARVAARWRMVTVPATDRELVRRAAVVCVSGLAIAGIGWTIAVAVAVDRLPHGQPVTAVTGSVLMLASAALAVSVVRRRVTSEDASTRDSAATSTGFVLGLGERAIRLVQRWPAMTCAAVALFGALAAMSRAETTFRAALLWGGAEAAAVVAGFVFLGPRLELRVARR